MRMVRLKPSEGGKGLGQSLPPTSCLTEAMSCLFFFFFNIYLFIYLAVLGLSCVMHAGSSSLIGD